MEKCKVCGKELDDHALIFKDGIAVAGAWAEPNEFTVCYPKEIEKFERLIDELSVWAKVKHRYEQHYDKLKREGSITETDPWGHPDLEAEWKSYARSEQEVLDAYHWVRNYLKEKSRPT